MVKEHKIHVFWGAFNNRPTIFCFVLHGGCTGRVLGGFFVVFLGHWKETLAVRWVLLYGVFYFTQIEAMLQASRSGLGKGVFSKLENLLIFFWLLVEEGTYKIYC